MNVTYEIKVKLYLFTSREIFINLFSINSQRYSKNKAYFYPMQLGLTSQATFLAAVGSAR